MTTSISSEVQDFRKKWTFVVQLVIWGKVQYQIWNPHRISKSKKKKKLFKSSRNNEIWPLWSWQSFGESTISDFESPSNFQVKEEKIYSNRSRNNEIGLLWSRQSFGESTISDFESPSFQVKKKYSNRSRNKEIGLLWSRQ